MGSDAFPVRTILREDGTLAPGAEVPKLADDALRAMYVAMLRTRLLDERCMLLQRQGRIAFYGASTGEEAAVIGTASAVEPSDWIFPALRQSGALLMRGFPLEGYFNHMFGNGSSIEKGRSMPMHFSDRTYHFVTWSSSMATQLPHAVGMAYAAKIKGEKTVALGYLGDGASSESDFHHALNFAAVWKTPVVFVLQNNGWAISVPTSKQTASATFAQKALAYGMPGVRVDGNDVLACYAAAKEAADRARRGEGPTLIEAVTYRIQGHSSSDDPTRYRPSAEVETWKRRDPIARFHAFLVAKGVWDAAREEKASAEIIAAIDAAIKAAEAAPPPAFETLIEEVYEKPTPRLERELAALRDARGR
ncbi:MAG TPA: thiamine pyrophosphate-dependent enzyme [Candidatus Thermoplasmatota archaeon]|nr:thiamine pyrophosphate-dependent enzyme [Candidatus Thermoplasmatota archaeon]